MSLAVVILAAGKSTRMKSRTSKVLHAVAGMPVISYPIAIAHDLRPERLVLVVGEGQRSLVEPVLNGIPVRWSLQREALGTGHAVQASANALRGFEGHVLILAGDVPCLKQETLRAFVDSCVKSGASGGVLTTEFPNPTGYGRIIRNGSGTVARIVEERDLSPAESHVREVNTGIFCCRADWLLSALKLVKPHNAQREYYLTDIVGVAASAGDPLIAVRGGSHEEFIGVNSRHDLAVVNCWMRRQIVLRHMSAGVGFVDADNVYIDADVRIGEDTNVGPGCIIRGRTMIGSGCIIDAGVVIDSAIICDRVHIKPYSVIEDCVIASGCVVGPFARLRPGARLDSGVHVGNFVEVKKSWLKKGVKANHLTYLGDATIGEGTNVGCGTITCNYDGKKKHPTLIGRNVFIGSDTAFVAPVRIGSGATTGAGSVITEDVPAGALAVARGRQVNIKGWGKRRGKNGVRG